MALGEPGGAARAPDSNFGEPSHQAQGVEMTRGLDAGTEKAERCRVLPGQEVGGDGGGGGGPELGDEPAIHHRHRLAGFRAEQGDEGVVGRDASVLRIEGHQLGAEGSGVGRHGAEEPPMLGHGHDEAKRLDGGARGVGGKGGPQGRDQVRAGGDAAGRRLRRGRE